MFETQSEAELTGFSLDFFGGGGFFACLFVCLFVLLSRENGSFIDMIHDCFLKDQNFDCAELVTFLDLKQFGL